MTTTERADAPVVANHHADHPGFAGARGAAKGLMFAARGSDNARLVADIAEVGSGDRVIDIGCGPGSAVREAAARGAHAIGIDPSPVMLSVARRLTLRHRPSIRWLEGTAEAIPADDARATIVWSVLCVHHWADVDPGITEAHRVLAPAGRLLAVERLTTSDATGVASHGWYPAQADVFAERCEALGFTKATISTRSAGGSPVIVVDAERAECPG